MQLLARSNGWSMFPYPGFPQIIQAKGSVAGSYISGAQCYDGTPAPCAADHYCIGIDFTTSEHACVRRFGTAGLFFNGGSFTGGYFPGRIWIR
jgi:hypothetical protein